MSNDAAVPSLPRGYASRCPTKACVQPVLQRKGAYMAQAFVDQTARWLRMQDKSSPRRSSGHQCNLYLKAADAGQGCTTEGWLGPQEALIRQQEIIFQTDFR